MKQHALDAGFSNITAFLALSCQYLGLNSTCLNQAASRVSSSLAERQAPASTPEPGRQRKTMNHYRHLAHGMLLAAGLGAFLAGPVFADPGCPPMGQNGTHQERHAKHMEQHHRQLHDALKLTPEQEPGWKKLMDSEQAKPGKGEAQAEDWSRLTAPERAEKMLESAKARQERMSEHVTALKAFYTTLSTDQKKTFEDFHAGPRGGMRGKRGARTPSAEKDPAKS